ncbi:MAG: hypothetical protein IT514_03295 [Burkholderiales bacterium]|nr:hypothetical protein [Burkholderiales bacterium]
MKLSVQLPQPLHRSRVMWSAEVPGIELDEADARYRTELEKYTRLVREAYIRPVD